MSCPQKMNIQPSDYMMLIFKMTRDLSRHEAAEHRVRAYRNTQAMRTEQILTERGLCYMSNNFLSTNMSSR